MSPVIVACQDCDFLHRHRLLRDGQRAMCARCGAVLYRKKRDSPDDTLVYSLTALILFCMAHVFPFMTFKYEGRVQESVLFAGVQELFVQDMWAVAILVLLVSVVIPLLKIVGILYVLVPLKLNRRPWYAAGIFRIVETLRPWAMVDVFMLGVIVAMVKLSDFATIVPGAALYSFAALLISMAAAGAALNPHEVWERLDLIEKRRRR
ncbi:MAG: paraquat-inducible protein A [Nitrospirales bacterium]